MPFPVVFIYCMAFVQVLVWKRMCLLFFALCDGVCWQQETEADAASVFSLAMCFLFFVGKIEAVGLTGAAPKDVK